jgi:hypothetical protein
MERKDLSQSEKLAGLSLILKAERDGRTSLTTHEIQRLASAKDRETVFRATRALAQKNLIRKRSRPGQSGVYEIILTSGPIEADRLSSSEPVGLQPTGRVDADRSNRTGRPDADRSRARIETPSGLLSPRENIPPGVPPSADEIARRAYLNGELIKQGAVAKSARATRRAKGELDGSRGILFESGKLTVANGAAAELRQDFPGIDLAAVCDRAGPGITRMNHPSRDDAMAELRKWARIASESQQARKPRRNGVSRYAMGSV